MDAIHDPIMVFSVIGIILWVWWAFTNKKKWGYAILPLLYLINVLVFFIVAHFNLLSKYTYNIWNDAIQFQAVLLMVIIAVGFLYMEGSKWIHRH
jgi:hypothetical protein